MNVGALEESLLHAIRDLLPYQPKPVLNQRLDTSLQPMLDRYSAFVRGVVKDQALLAEHKALHDQLVEIKKERNRIVHGPWLDVPGTDIDRQKIKVDQVLLLADLLKPNQTGTVVTPDDIIRLFNAVFLTRRQFQAHHAKVLGHVRASNP